MLKEYGNIRQEKNTFRRYFTDEEIDLYIWYKNDKKTVIGFQIIYNLKWEDNMKAFTWDIFKGTSHTKVYT